MSVYVDDMEAEFACMKMCHMIADSHDELMQMAKQLGLQPRWLQKPNTPHEHFDISKAKRNIAVTKFGAIEITQRELAKKCKERAQYAIDRSAR